MIRETAEAARELQSAVGAPSVRDTLYLAPDLETDMRHCKLCPTTITRRFAILCAKCCDNVTHDFKRMREILAR